MRRRQDERGAVAIMMALVICFVMLPITALAVDIGMQRVARRDAQAMADTAALDAARALSKGTTTRDALKSVAQQSVSADSSFVGRDAPTVDLFLGTLSTTFVSDQSLGCDGNPHNAYFKAVPAGGLADAVLVVVKNAVDFNFMPGGSGGVCRSAIAQAHKSACMMMDSYAAALKSKDSTVLGPLTKILGTDIDTTVLSSSGILTTDLNVLDFLNVLKTQLNVGSVDEVLDAHVSLTQLLQAEAAALTQQGTTGAVAANALAQQITAHIGNIFNPTGFKVGELLGITQGAASALGTTVNAFDLAAAAVQLANGTNPLTATLKLPSGLTGDTQVKVSVGSRPMRVCLGEGKKTMGQTSVTAELDLMSPGSFVGGLVTALTGLLNNVLCGVVGGILGADCYGIPKVSLGKVTASVSLASASGEVTALNCVGAEPKSLSITEEASLLPATLSIPLVISQERTYGPLLNRKKETVTSTLTITGSTKDQDKPVPATLKVPDDYDKGKPGPSGDLSITGLSLSSSLTTDGHFSNGTSLVDGLLGGVNSIINLISQNVLGPLLGQIATPLVNALTKVLQDTVGLTIAGSTYTPLRTPSCGVPALKG